MNDHLAGAVLGSALAEQLREKNEGTPLGDVMSSLAAWKVLKELAAQCVDHPLRQAQRREQTSQDATPTLARCLVCRHDLTSLAEAARELSTMRSELTRVRKQTEPLPELIPAVERLIKQTEALGTSEPYVAQVNWCRIRSVQAPGSAPTGRWLAAGWGRR